MISSAVTGLKFAKGLFSFACGSALAWRASASTARGTPSLRSWFFHLCGGGQGTPHSASCFFVQPPFAVDFARISASVIGRVFIYRLYCVTPISQRDRASACRNRLPRYGSSSWLWMLGSTRGVCICQVPLRRGACRIRTRYRGRWLAARFAGTHHALSSTPVQGGVGEAER